MTPFYDKEREYKDEEFNPKKKLNNGGFLLKAL
jgi:hypothetical protein